MYFFNICAIDGRIYISMHSRKQMSTVLKRPGTPRHVILGSSEAYNFHDLCKTDVLLTSTAKTKTPKRVLTLQSVISNTQSWIFIFFTRIFALVALFVRIQMKCLKMKPSGKCMDLKCTPWIL